MSRQQRTRPDGFDALPKRFRDYVRNLEDAISGLEATRPGIERTRVSVVDYSSSGGDDAQFLGENLRLRFDMSRDGTAGDRVHIEVRLARDGEGVEVTGSESLIVAPNVSNVVHVMLRRPR